MKDAYIQRLINEHPRDTFRNIPNQLKPLRGKDPAVIGIDTEYLSAPPHTQLTWQFSYNGETHVEIINRGDRKPRKLWTFLELIQFVRVRFNIPKRRHIILVSFWSNAEIMNLSDWDEHEVIQLHPSGVSNVVYRNNNRKEYAELYDIWHFFGPGYSLDKVAKSYGYKKFDYDTSTVTFDSLNDPVFIEYAAHDPVLCELIFNDLRKAFLELGADIVDNKTAASASMAAFRRVWLSEPLQPAHRRVRTAALRANHGGRAEQFQLHYEGPLNEYDANSLYPYSVLAVGTFPYYNQWKHTRKLSEIRGSLGGFGTFTFQYPRGTRYPCMPVEHDTVGLVFPLSGVSECSTYEALYAMEQGAKVTPIDCWIYTEPGTSEYADFIRYLIDLKQKSNDNGNAGMRAAAKLAMNSGIGKMIQTKSSASLSDLRKFGIEQGLTLRQLLDPSVTVRALDEFREAHQIKIGGSFIPEWHTLILGKSRAVMAKFLDAIQPFTISTDGCIAPSRSELPVIEGVHFEPKHEIDGDGMRFIRERVGYISRNGDPVDVKHHSIHTPNKTLQIALIDGTERSYTRARLVNLREVAGGVAEPLSREEHTMLFQRFGSRKRLWTGNYSEPWKSIEEIPGIAPYPVEW